MSPASRQRGFTLLETMVALVIFTGAALALYALFNTNLIALTRAHDVSRQMPAVRHAIEHLSSINPRDEGEGRFEIDGLDVAWSATLLEPPRQSQDHHRRPRLLRGGALRDRVHDERARTVSGGPGECAPSGTKRSGEPQL